MDELNKKNETNPPVLTDRGGLGGLIAQDGFDYQIFDAIMRIPAWLMTASFESVMVEAQEDFEARFFAPHAPHGYVLERFQGKTSELRTADLTEVLRKFESLEKAFPATTRRYVLVTPSLSSGDRWLTRNKERVENSRPFYQPFAGILRANDAALQDRYQREFGAELGAFATNCVDIDLHSYPSREQAVSHFGHSLLAAFGGEGYLTVKVARAFDNLFCLLQKERGTHISRYDLIEILQATLVDLPSALTGPSLQVKLVQTEADATAAAIEIDTGPFRLGEQAIPPPAVWAEGLLRPLTNLAQWAGASHRHQIALKGNYRLTTAFATGYSLRSAIGFDLMFYNREVCWQTSTHPGQDTSPLNWAISPPSRLHNGRLLVLLGIVRDPLPVVLSTFDANIVGATLTMQLMVGIQNSEAAQMGVAQIKRALDEAVTRLRPRGIDLFYVGPAAFAVALGHRWNKLPSTQLYEFDGGAGRYWPTAIIG